MADPAALRRLALEIHERLAPVYGAPLPRFQSLGPLEELVSSFINHRTRNRDAKRAYHALRERFPDWADLRDAPTAEVEALLAPCTWPEQKAPRLQEVLRRITEARGALDLDFLGDLPVPEARAWLEALPGVGPKTSAAVLSFSTLRGRALPVDSHHHRVAQRVGLIPKSVAVGPSHARLEALMPEAWGEQEVYDHHQLFMRHGQKVCHYRGPECDHCVLLDLCPEGRARLPDAVAHEAGPSGEAPPPERRDLFG
ncbi:endonuclease III [Jannaschia sp. W003]|uniref:endonuclease III domain-containing protein n=1 Tax=Jannaschia sp. W003 TaxID=2867012 RepID=UPI0021A92638|nr:hypothetical protein [Jannaschia sp. W003]UWQ21941.1 hypothetical protein K3554_02605 [Jannaschia sp. W003]